MASKISIIMPAFAVEKHTSLLTKALNGIINQTYRNWELLIISDGGGKKTLDILIKEINVRKDARIMLFKSSAQMGPGIVRNMAIKYISGDFLTFHDTDDYSEPNRFEMLIKNVDANGIVASNVMVNYLYEGTNTSSRLKVYSGVALDELINNRKVRAPFHFPSAIISTALFKKMGGFEQYKYSADATMAIKLSYLRELTGIKSVPLVSDPLFVWNRHSHSITTKFENAYVLKKCQSAQRKPLIREFRKMVLDKAITASSPKKEIMKALKITNNLANTADLIRVL